MSHLLYLLVYKKELLPEANCKKLKACDCLVVIYSKELAYLFIIRKIMQTKKVFLKIAVNFKQRRPKTALKINILQLKHCGTVNKKTLTITSIFCKLPSLLLFSLCPFLCNCISTALVRTMIIHDVANG